MKINLRNTNTGVSWLLLLTVIALLAIGMVAKGQTFTYQSSDLCLTFRKVTPYAENNEAVVNIGQASNYLNAAVGTKMPVPGFSASQLVPGTFESLNNLSWAVFGWYIFAPSLTNYAGYPHGTTLWLTVPRTDNAVRSPDAIRVDNVLQQQTETVMSTLLNDARYISHQIAISNAYNTAQFVREPIAGYPDRVVSVLIGSPEDNSIANFSDNWATSVEATTSGAFGGEVRADLYEVRPISDISGNLVVDPHTGTNGLAYYVGYFELTSDGTMTFTRDAVSTPSSTPPPVLSIQRSGTTSTISFGTTNGAVYSLYYTNAAGLTSPIANWALSASTVTGNGQTNTLTDTTTDANRVYRVVTH